MYIYIYIHIHIYRGLNGVAVCLSTPSFAQFFSWFSVNLLFVRRSAHGDVRGFASFSQALSSIKYTHFHFTHAHTNAHEHKHAFAHTHLLAPVNAR